MQNYGFILSIIVSLLTISLFMYSFKYYKKHLKWYKLPGFNHPVNLKDKETIALFIVFFIPYINLFTLTATLVVGFCFVIINLTNIVSHYINKYL
jgi:accessory gene regulator protein AgrB